MSKNCPLCGENIADKSLFCPKCTDKLNNEYELDVPASEKTEANAEKKKIDARQSDYEKGKTAKEFPESKLDQKAWKRQRVDERSKSDKTYYELSKEKKGGKVVFFLSALFALVLALIVGLYIYNKDVKSDNLERSKWEIAQRINSVDSYLMYMDEFPQGTYVDEAYTYLLALKNEETEAFQNLMTSENRVEFSAFFEQYPESPYERKVRNRLDSLIWQSSLKENSSESYLDYINRTSSKEITGDYIGEAQKRFEMLNQATPIDEADLEQIKTTVGGFFIGISTLSHTALSEYLAPVIIRYNNETNLQIEEMIGRLMLQASKASAKSFRFDAEVMNLQYIKMENGMYEVNVPVQKIFEESGEGINQMKGYIVHLKLTPDFKIYSFYETKPYAEAP